MEWFGYVTAEVRSVRRCSRTGDVRCYVAVPGAYDEIEDVCYLEFMVRLASGNNGRLWLLARFGDEDFVYYYGVNGSAVGDHSHLLRAYGGLVHFYDATGSGSSRAEVSFCVC